MSTSEDWQVIKYSSSHGVSRRLARLKVFEGWLVREIFDDASERLHTETMIFMPDKNHKWNIHKEYK
jgi:hypothetical protein